MKIRTNTQIEGILRMAFCLDGNSIKDVAEMANINQNILYKWNCGAMRFSPDNIDKLLMYFHEYEPERFDRAERMYDALRGIK
ncbi:MAG: helix-turn-helix transcriptional regulator [Clostridiales bacterium]|nr:helix-turn-helix transcriptional regulator [Clostridiales bacterium]